MTPTPANIIMMLIPLGAVFFMFYFDAPSWALALGFAVVSSTRPTCRCQLRRQGHRHPIRRTAE
jgi:hypothetical protein